MNECPYCKRIMSRREAAEQGACNDCSGGAADIDDESMDASARDLDADLLREELQAEMGPDPEEWPS